jgi:hypothetical protein
MTFTMFAATGWTQAGWFFKLVLCWLAVIYILSRVILGWRVWSWKPVLLAAGLALGIGLLFTPWSSLADIKSSDPDVLLWHRRFRATAFAWMFAAAASFFSLAIIWVLRGLYAVRGPGELWLFVWRPWKSYRSAHSRLRPMATDDHGGDVIIDSERKQNAPEALKMAKTTSVPALPAVKPER